MFLFETARTLAGDAARGSTPSAKCPDTAAAQKWVNPRTLGSPDTFTVQAARTHFLSICPDTLRPDTARTLFRGQYVDLFSNKSKNSLADFADNN